MATIFAQDHQKWLNYLQPEGLVLSSVVLEDAQVNLPAPAEQRALQLKYLTFVDDPQNPQVIRSWEVFSRDFLGWNDAYQLKGEAIPDSCRLVLPEYQETLAPTQVLVTPRSHQPFALMKEYAPTIDLAADPTEGHQWRASPIRKMERLLVYAGLTAGIVTNGRQILLISKPRGENLGVLTFPVGPMGQTMGRPILGALELLLGATSLWGLQGDRQLVGLLENSRKAQAKVSTALSRQVLGALYELLRGFAAAHVEEPNPLLAAWVAENPQGIYGGLLTVMMRLVFLLYTEDRGLMPATDVYDGAYSVHGLWAKLRNDARQYPDTMDRRYGAWAQLLALFRVVYEGCDHPDLKLPARWGHLFDPDRYPFLEGEGGVPPVSDGTLFTALNKLLVLNGEKLSYRTLDVEQIGSVYEAVMGFEFQVVKGLSVAIKPAKSHGAPPIVDLDHLLTLGAKKRKEVFQEETDRKLTPKVADALGAAGSTAELLAAVEDLIDRDATPHPVAAGGWVLQPTDERRRSGSHYTPRSLTAPIVEKALEPLWLRLGDHPTPEAILDLKVCDPAMGSGAFLVEACRQIADRLEKAWQHHDCQPQIPVDEDALLHARRLVAQRCLYGVDRNPMAVDLAKLSLWLATLAQDHPFTFLDHNFRQGDSLVGLSLKQIRAFHWNALGQVGLVDRELHAAVASAVQIRQRILEAPEETGDPAWKANQLAKADEKLGQVRLVGDAIVAAWFGADKDKARLTRLGEYQNLYQWAGQRPDALARLETEVRALRTAAKPVWPFHWELEYPEVFQGTDAGFDAIVGNPPFMGGTKITSSSGKSYSEWLAMSHPGSHGNGDLVAHFFRRAYNLLKAGASLGLIATNTISQGDTRQTGLASICRLGGQIYSANRRLRWPGEAAVIVSVVHVFRGQKLPNGVDVTIDGRPADRISAFLFESGGDDTPERLIQNQRRAFVGSKVYGQGFIFDDSDDAANSTQKYEELISSDSKNRERILPYLGGEEVNSSPGHLSHRWVISFEDMSEGQARKWPELWGIVEQKVKPERAKLNMATPDGRRRAERFWQWGRFTPALWSALKLVNSCFVISGVTQHAVFAKVSSNLAFSHSLVVFPTSSWPFFAVLQSRVHELWARFLGSSMKDDLRYTPSDCFETFPFPADWESNADLEAAGQAYYEFRAQLMVKNNEGLTKTYNRFHNRFETSPEIAKLRELHSAMDQTVLKAYGWTDLDTTCQFIADYEVEAEEGEKKPKKAPEKYRFSNETRDVLLARLLELNATRAAGQPDVPTTDDDEDTDEEALDD